MLHTINLSASMRTALEDKITHSIAANELRSFRVVAQSGAFIFCEASIHADAYYAEAQLHALLRPLREVGYVPLIIVEQLAARGSRLVAAPSHKTETWQDQEGDICVGILRTARPYMLFSDTFEVLASADPGADMHLPKFIRAAQRWRALHPTRGTAAVGSV